LVWEIAPTNLRGFWRAGGYGGRDFADVPVLDWRGDGRLGEKPSRCARSRKALRNSLTEAGSPITRRRPSLTGGLIGVGDGFSEAGAKSPGGILTFTIWGNASPSEPVAVSSAHM
jgi:hypothetical protein